MPRLIPACTAAVVLGSLALGTALNQSPRALAHGPDPSSAATNSITYARRPSTTASPAPGKAP